MARNDDTQGTVSGRRVSGLDDTIGEVPAPTPAHGQDGDLAKGQVVGEYVIDEVLGRGGFGTVYRATHPLIGKHAAIKVLSHRFSADHEVVSRFVAEARAVNQIRHRHIIDIFAFGQLADGRHYYVMELLEGEPLDRYLARHGPLRVEEAVPILRAIARALDAAHAKGVAHRDLKPENVFLARDDDGGLFPKLLDFGIAKLSNTEEALAHKTNTGVPLGTPYYMSPEQCRGKDVDHRTDIYSFGVLAYRLLTQAYPFDGGLIEILHQQMHDEPPPPSSKNTTLGPAVDSAITWMMRKDPAERPTTATRALAALEGELPAIATPASMAPVSPVARPRRPWLAITAAVGVLAAAAVVVVLVRGGSGEGARGASGGGGLAAAPVDAAPMATGDAPREVGIDAPPVEAAAAPPATVLVDVKGVPEGTEVFLQGKLVGAAPGQIQIPTSERAIQLTFRADGYLSTSRTVTPARDQELVLVLKRKPRAAVRPVRPVAPEPDVDALPDVFGKERRK